MAFRVRHRDHAGSVISTHTPVGGSLQWTYRAGQPGDITYQLPQSDIEVSRDSFASYRTDFLLQHRPNNAGPWISLIGGIHTPVRLKNDTDLIEVGGRDWAHWLEQPVWFDYYNYNWSQAGDAFEDRRRDIIKANKTVTTGIFQNIAILAFLPPVSQEDIIRTLITNTKRGPNYPNISAVFTGSAGVSQFETTSYIINFQDTTHVLQHINTIAALDDPYGFDWTMNPDKKMEFFGPRKNRRESPDPIWVIKDSDIIEHPILELDWANNGPLGTHVVGLSIGSPALWWFKRDQDSVDKFREWLKIEHVGDQYIKGPEMRYAVDGLDYIHPQKDVKIVVDPSLLEGGFRNQIGNVVRIIWDFPPYHEVNAYYWINEQSYENTDAAGNWRLNLSLQQIYDK